MATAFPTYTYTGLVASHEGRRGVEPWGFFECRDGMVLLQVTEDRQWVALGTILGDPEWARMEIFATTAERIELADALDLFLVPAIAEWTVADFLLACHEGGVAAARIHSAADLLTWDHAVARGNYRSVSVDPDGTHCDVLVPVPGWRYRNTYIPIDLCTPRLGEAGDGTTPVWDVRPTVAPAPAIDAPTAPLAGLRVVDLTWVWAGPFAAMQLAHLGAEVVKIESSSRPDVTRLLGPWLDGEQGPNRSGYFNQYNLGKQSMLLDLKSSQGLDILREMLRRADVVIDNMSVGALARLGFSYDELRQLNPRIVAVSMTGFGESGPECEHMAYGSLIDALSGAASSNGAPGGGPTDFVMSLPDPTAGIHAAIATVAAVLRARATGVGERVECSMLEASVAAFPWPILYQGVTGDGPPVEGNRDELRAPHDVYRCVGDYAWVAIAVENESQFAALCRVIGQPELALDERFSTLAGRRCHAVDLDKLIAAWSVTLEPSAAEAALHAACVPAQAVLHIDGAFHDGRLQARGLFIRLPHPEVGDRELCGPPWHASRSPMTATSAAPCLGADSRAVLRNWLGMDSDAIERLAAAGVLRPTAQQRHTTKPNDPRTRGPAVATQGHDMAELTEDERRAFIADATAWLNANAEARPPRKDFAWGQGPDEVRLMRAEHGDEDRQLAEARTWRAKVFDAGFGWLGGPVEHGGGGRHRELDAIYRGLESDFVVPDQSAWQVAWEMVAPAVQAHGSDDLKRRYLRRIHRGELLCSQLLSEPQGGSDLAGLSTRAVRDGDEWVVNGQKVWNSYAHKADLGQLMARTDPDVPKHQGITMFLLPMDTPGLDVRPLKQMNGGAEFNEVFLTDVRVADNNRVGDAGGGWRAVLTTLMSERASVGSGKSRTTDPVQVLIEMARHFERSNDPVIRQRLADLYGTQRLIEFLTMRAEALVAAGRERGAEGSIVKLIGSRQNGRLADLAGTIMGPLMQADTGDWGTYSWSQFLCSAPGLRIAGGTDEIQRNIIGERVLGLPKEPPVK